MTEDTKFKPPIDTKFRPQIYSQFKPQIIGQVTPQPGPDLGLWRPMDPLSVEAPYLTASLE